MKIEAYSFGSMTVDGKTYKADLIVYPDNVRSDWWRKEGHSLALEDLSEVLDCRPEVLVIGTGAYGVMKIPSSTRKACEEKQIEVIEGSTKEACRLFNEQVQKGKKVVGAFHLTC